MKRSLLLLCVGLIATALWLTLPEKNFQPAIDFRVFWQAAGDSPSALYSRPHTPFVNPPSAVFWLKPLGWLDFRLAFWLFAALSCVAFYAVVERAYERHIAVASLGSTVVFVSAGMGQITLMLGSATILAFLLGGFGGGMLLGIVASIKPHMILLAPLALIVRRDWTMLAGAMAGGVLSFAISFGLYGGQPWFDWVAALPRFHASLGRLELLPYVISPAGFAQFLGFNALPALLVGILAGAFIVWRSTSELEPGPLAGVVVGCSLLASPYAMGHDLVAVVPLMVAVILGQRRVLQIPALALFVGGFQAVALLWFLIGHEREQVGTQSGSNLRNRRVGDPVWR